MIKINKLEKTFGPRKLFEIDSMQVNPEDKVALIGRNGVGKTTLFNIILGKDLDYKGQVQVTMNIRYVDRFDKEDDIGGKTYSMLDFSEDERLSPGQVHKLNLLEAVDDYNFIMMDEPTANLDFEGINALVERLRQRKAGYMLISHDRDFIEKTCDKVYEIFDGKLYEYKGSYSFYEQEKARIIKTKMREYDQYKSEVERLEKSIDQISHRKDSVRTTPRRMGNSEARLHKMGGQGNKKKMDNQIKAIKSRIENLEVKEKPAEETEISLTIPDGQKIRSKNLIQAKGLDKSFPGKTIFKKANFIINSEDKYALLGPNGSGKSTLLKMIIDGEDIYRHPKLKIGYFGQLQETMDLYGTIMENIEDVSIYDETMNRIVLARLGFRRDSVFKKFSSLSDGEKAKVKLAKALLGDFNILILDEPTNYLDIPTIEVLEEVLRNYDRPLIFVSHDRRFVDNITDRLLTIEDKKIKSFKGNLSDYEERGDLDMDELMLDFEISKTISRLSMEIPKDEREKLEERYDKLIDKR